LDPDSRLDNHTTFPARAFDEPFTRCLRTGQLFADALNAEPQQLRHQLGILHFATPDEDSTQFKTRVDDTNTILSMELVDRDKEQKKASNWLYYFGKMKTAADLHAIIANFKAVFFPLIVGFLESDLWLQLAAIDRRLATSTGQRWLKHHSVDSPVLVQHLIDKFQSILSKHVELSNQQTFRDALREKTPLNPRLFEQANVYSTVIAQQIDQSISQHEVKQWSGVPRWVPMLKLESGSQVADDSTARPNKIQRTTPTAPPARAPGAAGAAAPPRQPPGGALTPEQISRRKTQGFLKWTGRGSPPTCPVMWPAATGGNEKRLCISFAAQGLYCSTDRCTNIHCPSFNRVPVAKQAALTSYVTATNGLTFSTGNAPAST
jgi:hypothetical protein